MFTKKFRTLDPNPPTVLNKVLKKRISDSFPYPNLTYSSHSMVIMSSSTGLMKIWDNIILILNNLGKCHPDPDPGQDWSVEATGDQWGLSPPFPPGARVSAGLYKSNCTTLSNHKNLSLRMHVFKKNCEKNVVSANFHHKTAVFTHFCKKREPYLHIFVTNIASGTTDPGYWLHIFL